MAAGLYIHVPYCRSKCAYCDFYSSPGKDTLPEYVDAVLAEASLRREEIAGPFTTLYLGGGTPSLLPDTGLQKLIDGLSSALSCRFDEATIEANPEDISPQRLAVWQKMGINRVSIGVQSFDDRMLAAIGRRHDAADSRRALECLAGSGINFSADLIYGLPGQTPSDWECELSALLAFHPPHISAYLLSYEEGTLLYRRLCRGEVEEADDILAERLYGILCASASSAGYEHYEISNFAIPGKRSRHNSSYWNMTPYLGLGAAAHSFDGALRRFNPPSSTRYIHALLRWGKTCFETDTEDATSQANDLLLTSLRTVDGFAPAILLSNGNGYTLTEGQRLQLIRDIRSLLSDGLLEQIQGSASGDGICHPTTRLRIPENRWLLSDAIVRRLFLSH